jgi:hypothetical protein
MESPRSPSLNRRSPLALQSSLLHSEHLDSRRMEKTSKFPDSAVATIASVFSLSTFLWFYVHTGAPVAPDILLPDF